jgi:hypothetical protein
MSRFLVARRAAPEHEYGRERELGVQRSASTTLARKLRSRSKPAAALRGPSAWRHTDIVTGSTLLAQIHKSRANAVANSAHLGSTERTRLR